MMEYRFRPLPTDSLESGEQLFLTQAVVDEMSRILPKNVGMESHENVVYIAGIIEVGRRIGTTVVVPNAETGRGGYDTNVDSHADVLNLLVDLDLAIVAQVHTHPGSLVYHSDADDDLAFIRAEGFWSLVVPNYGRNGVLPMVQCGIHCFKDGVFHLLTQDAAVARVHILPSSCDLRTKQ